MSTSLSENNPNKHSAITAAIVEMGHDAHEQAAHERYLEALQAAQALAEQNEELRHTLESHDRRDCTPDYMKVTGGADNSQLDRNAADVAASQGMRQANLPRPTAGQISQTEALIGSHPHVGRVFVALRDAVEAPSAQAAQTLAKSVADLMATDANLHDPKLAGALTAYQANPGPAQQVAVLQAARVYLQVYVTPNGGNVVNPALRSKGGLTATTPVNVWAMVFLAMRESYKQNNAQKQYVLAKLQQFNIMSEGMNAYIKSIESAQAALDVKVRDCGKDAEAAMSQWVDFHAIHYDDFTSLSNGEVRFTDGGNQQASSTMLNDYLKELEQSQTTLSNYRQQATNDYQDCDQKANQAFTTWSDFVKNLGQMANIGTKNLGG